MLELAEANESNSKNKKRSSKKEKVKSDKKDRKKKERKESRGSAEGRPKPERYNEIHQSGALCINIGKVPNLPSFHPQVTRLLSETLS
jgi:hypothetical protein